MSKNRYTSAELDARLKFALGIMLGVILLSTTLGILYALIFVTQPVTAQSENDKMFFNVLVVLLHLLLVPLQVCSLVRVAHKK